MKLRLITAFILIPFVIATLFWLSLLWFTIVILIVCMLAAWEWGNLSGFTSHFQLVWLVVLCGLLLSLMLFTIFPYYKTIQLLQFSSSLSASLSWWVVALLLVLFYPGSAGFWRRSRVLRLLFGMLTIVPFFFSMVALRQYHYSSDHFVGAWWILYVMVLVWGADSGAYMFGRLFGKHELAPKVSPGKTWEGFFGGMVTAVLVSWLFGWCAPLIVTPGMLISSSVIATLASALGDLTESMFKREAGIKNSGYLLPGHGGILDRIDSLTAAMPIFTFLMFLIFKAL